MLKIFSCRLSGVNKRAWSAAPLGAERSAKRFCRVVTQTRARIKGKPCFACSRAGGENSLSTLDWGKSAIRALFFVYFIFPLDRLAIPEYGYGNSNPKPLSMERPMTGIYNLPENPSAADIIERSIIAHPSLFREALIKQAEQHDDYSRLTHNAGAQRGAIASKNACLRAYDFIGDSDNARSRAETLCSETGPAVIALNVACKLQCLPPHIRTAAACTLDEGN